MLSLRLLTALLIQVLLIHNSSYKLMLASPTAFSHHLQFLQDQVPLLLLSPKEVAQYVTLMILVKACLLLVKPCTMPSPPKLL
jgi:hypothetical protein